MRQITRVCDDMVRLKKGNEAYQPVDVACARRGLGQLSLAGGTSDCHAIRL